MKAISLILALALPFGAMAQGFTDEPVCYSWEGGHKSAGSFSKCPPAWVMPAKKAPAAVVTPVASPQIAPSPIMMPITCAPAPKPVLKKRRPAPKKC